MESVPVLLVIETFMGLTESNEIYTLLNEKGNVGSSPIFVQTYMDQDNGLFHDSFLSKLSNSFFAVLPASNHLSINSMARYSRRRVFARLLDEKRES